MYTRIRGKLPTFRVKLPDLGLCGHIHPSFQQSFFSYYPRRQEHTNKGHTLLGHMTPIHQTSFPKCINFGELGAELLGLKVPSTESQPDFLTEFL